jgi:hypothetical protein
MIKKFLLIIFLTVLFTGNAFAETNSFGLLISSDVSKNISDKFKSEILKEFEKKNFLFSKSATKQLVIYINRDSNDDINPNGISLSIAHIDGYHVPVILDVLKQHKENDKELTRLLAPLIQEYGFLKHLSSVHLSTGDESQIIVASKSIVEIFISKNFK